MESFEDDQEDERRRDEKIDSDTQGGPLDVRQQPVPGRIFRKEVRQRKFKQQPIGSVSNPTSDVQTATHPASVAIWRIEWSNYRRRRNQHSVGNSRAERGTSSVQQEQLRSDDLLTYELLKEVPK